MNAIDLRIEESITINCIQVDDNLFEVHEIDSETGEPFIWYSSIFVNY